MQRREALRWRASEEGIAYVPVLPLGGFTLPQSINAVPDVARSDATPIARFAATNLRS